MTKTVSQRKKVCPNCSREFVTRHQQNMQLQIHCSRACYYAARRAKLDDVVSRFWNNVVKRGDDECWGWTAQKRWDGYGRFVNRYRPMWAHRFSYELHHGPIPKGMSVMHSCDNPECTNPKHLSLGTHQENMADAKAKRRHTHGSRNKHAKLTEAQVREIRQRFKFISPRKTNADELAPEYGVRPDVIYMAGTRRTWKHVE
jgi:ribosomal protein S27AE